MVLELDGGGGALHEESPVVVVGVLPLLGGRCGRPPWAASRPDLDRQIRWGTRPSWCTRSQWAGVAGEPPV